MMDEEALNASTTADSLLACLSAPDRALLSSFKNETNEPWTSYTAAKSVMTLRNQLCKQIYHDLPPEIAKKIAESSATASEHLSAKVYGEIEFAAYFNVLQQCSPCENTTIVDLGHGTGKALIAAFALYGDKLRKIHGIEIVPELLEESRRRIQMMETISLEQISSNIGSFQPFLRESLAGRSLPEVITVEYGDFLLENCEYDWTQAGNELLHNLIFSNTNNRKSDIIFVLIIYNFLIWIQTSSSRTQHALALS